MKYLRHDSNVFRKPTMLDSESPIIGLRGPLAERVHTGTKAIFDSSFTVNSHKIKCGLLPASQLY